MASVGSMQATTVATEEVNFNIVLSEYTAMPFLKSLETILHLSDEISCVRKLTEDWPLSFCLPCVFFSGSSDFAFILSFSHAW
jgi:hypothetical protein